MYGDSTKLLALYIVSLEYRLTVSSRNYSVNQSNGQKPMLTELVEEWSDLFLMGSLK